MAHKYIIQKRRSTSKKYIRAEDISIMTASCVFVFDACASHLC